MASDKPKHVAKSLKLFDNKVELDYNYTSINHWIINKSEVSPKNELSLY